jgi:hypothetical protein
MAKATTIKDAIKAFEERKSVVAAEVEKVGGGGGSAGGGEHVKSGPSRERATAHTQPGRGPRSKDGGRHRRCLQVELNGVCPPIEKMDATLSTLKACK